MTKIKNKKPTHAYKTTPCSIKLSTTLSTQPNLPHVPIKKTTQCSKKNLPQVPIKKKKNLLQVHIKKKSKKKKSHYTHKARVMRLV